MPKFTRNSCAALTWSANGECRAVRVKRSGDQCRVVAFWAGKCDQNHTVADILADAVKAVDAHDASLCLAAGTQGTWSSADVAVPQLPPEQLRNALAFELRKFTPLPLDRLSWGFRLIKKANATEKAVYRLIFIRNENWKQWCANATAIGQVDALIPAAAALDPLLAESNVVFPRNNSVGDAYAPGPNGREFSHVPTNDQNGAPIPLKTLLNADFYDFDEIEKLPMEEQYQYADALIIAAYGLTEFAAKDAPTLPPLPEGIKPHRNIALVILAGILGAVTVAALLLYGIIALQGNLSQRKELKKQIAAIDKQINEQAAIIKKDRIAKMEELKSEIKGTLPDYPPFSLVLADITNIIDSERDLRPWISTKLDWSHDSRQMKFTVEEPFRDPTDKVFIEQVELIDALNDSPYIIEARGNNSNIVRNENKRVRDFTITIGKKEDQEAREAGARRNAERQKQRDQLRRAQQEAKAKAEAEAKAQTQTNDQVNANEEDEQLPDNVQLPPVPGIREGRPRMFVNRQGATMNPPPPPPPTQSQLPEGLPQAPQENAEEADIQAPDDNGALLPPPPPPPAF